MRHLPIATRIAALAFVLVFATVALFYWLSTVKNREIVLGLERKKMDNQAHRAADYLQMSIRSLQQDVTALASSPDVGSLIRARSQMGDAKVDPTTGQTENRIRKKLSETFKELLESKEHYLQARILNENGMEIVRAHREKCEKPVVIVPDEDLAPKHESQYYIKTKELLESSLRAPTIPKNLIYLSKIDLNKEKGKVTPEKIPVLRAAVPLHSMEKFAGLVIINMDFESIAKRMQKMARDNQYRLYVTNHHGDFLIHEDPDRQWGFDLGKPYRVEDEWGKGAISDWMKKPSPDMQHDQEVASVETSFHFVRLSYDPNARERFLALAVSAPRSQMLQDASEFCMSLLGWGAGFLLVAILLSQWVGRWISRPLKHITLATEQVAQGNFSVSLPTKAKDEIGALARSFQHMMQQVQENRTMLEQRVQERTARLEQKNEELAAARDATEAAMKAQEDFLSNLAHDLRTPLTIVIGYSQEVLRVAERQEITEIIPDLDLVVHRGNDLLELVNDLLNLSRVINGKPLELELKSFDVEEMVRKRMEGISYIAQRNRNKILLECQEDLGTMVADGSRVWRILMNLLSNACKFTRKGTIRLVVKRETTPEKDEVIFQVIDNGKGIPSQRLKTLFHRFEQVDARDALGGGFGLGLSICVLYCRLMGGRIQAESEEGKGSTFTVTLPVTPFEGEAKKKPTREAARSSPASLDEANMILIIEDDTALSELMRRNLTEAGYETRTVTSGEEGLRLAKELMPSAIVLDVVLPGIDGWAVLAALRTDRETADIPIIMSTMLDERRRGMGLGADAHLTKPFHADRLAQILQQNLEEKAHMRALIVENDADSRTRLAQVLREHRWLVQEASDGREAIDLIHKETPSLILLDLMLPDGSGLEVIAEVRKHAEWRNIPILVITNEDLDIESRRQLQGQVQQVLCQGLYGRDELFQEIRRHVGEARSRRLMSESL